jgi:hypothetical protein
MMQGWYAYTVNIPQVLFMHGVAVEWYPCIGTGVGPSTQSACVRVYDCAGCMKCREQQLLYVHAE